jgi:hypothetical protein
MMQPSRQRNPKHKLVGTSPHPAATFTVAGEPPRGPRCTMVPTLQATFLR